MSDQQPDNTSNPGLGQDQAGDAGAPGATTPPDNPAVAAGLPETGQPQASGEQKDDLPSPPSADPGPAPVSNTPAPEALGNVVTEIAQDVVALGEVALVVTKFHDALHDLVKLMEQGITNGKGEIRAILAGMKQHM